jgi:hypothetical protein
VKALAFSIARWSIRNTTDVINGIDTSLVWSQYPVHLRSPSHGTFPYLRQSLLPFRPRFARGPKAPPPFGMAAQRMPGMRLPVVGYLPLLRATVERNVAWAPRTLRALPSSISRVGGRVAARIRGGCNISADASATRVQPRSRRSSGLQSSYPQV